MAKDNHMQLFNEKCAEKGLKITPQRVVVYEELLKSKDHPGSDDLYKRVRKIFPNISFDTVYRTLLSFYEMGLVNLVEGYGEKKRFDPNIHNHHHFRCVKCRKIIDFSNDDFDKIEIPEPLKKEFNILNKRVVLEGICRKCCK